MHISAKAMLLPPEDVRKLLRTPMYKRLKEAMFSTMAKSFMAAYRKLWSETTGKTTSEYDLANNTSTTEHAKLAVKNWLACWLEDQAVTQEEFIHRANESKPKHLKFIQLSSLAGAFGVAVRDYVHPKDRPNPNMPTGLWKDANGQEWCMWEGEAVRIF